VPKLEQVLKSEIIRLARKQIRAACGPLARDVRELKRRVSQLSKTVVALDKMRAALEARKAAEGTKLEAPEEKVKAARLSPLLIKKLRTRLGISQGQLASLIGVSGPAVAHWEQGKSRPQGQNRAALVALRGIGKRQVKRMLSKESIGLQLKLFPQPSARLNRADRQLEQWARKQRLPIANVEIVPPTGRRPRNRADCSRGDQARCDWKTDGHTPDDRASSFPAHSYSPMATQRPRGRFFAAGG